ncbi:hypothetical protein [Anaplasma bovis]|uniref:hypothetical protein n=1 Tax=Anaplasma bovis TaxID=186733 RepID=UPI002FEE7F19
MSGVSIVEECAFRSILDSKSNNLYNFSTQAAKHASYYASGTVDAEGVYQLLCDAISSVLIPEHHISCALKAEERHEQVRSGYESKFLSLGSYSEIAFSEVVHVCKNHDTQDFTFLRPYLRAHHSLYIFKYTFGAIEALIAKDEAFLDTSTFSLLYGSFSEHFEAYKDFSYENKPLAMYFIEEHDVLYAALSNRDRKKFFEAMHDLTLRDSSTIRTIFCVLAHHMPTFRSMYNNLLLCALFYSRNELSSFAEQKHYIAYNAEIAINVLLKFSTKFRKEVSRLLRPEAPDDLVEKVTTQKDVEIILRGMGDDLEKLVSSIDMPVYGDVDPSKFSGSNDLEKIAAMHLILYPGSTINGGDILLGDEKLYMLHVDSGKIKPTYEPLTTFSAKHKKIAIMEDIQKIFSSLQELCGHLDCETFIEELRTYCAMMRSKHYAIQIQNAIASRVKQLPENTELSRGDLPTVAFESILPRIVEIEEFLQDELMVKITIQFTRFLHNSEKLILSAPDFLRICGYLDTNNASFINNCAAPTALLDHIEQNYKHFASLATKGRSSTRLPSPTSRRRERDPELRSDKKYKISTLSSGERNSALKQLSARSISRIIYYILVRISPILALTSITFIICFALTYGEMSLACALMVPITCAFIIFLATYVREEATKAEKKYIMSIPPSTELAVGDSAPSTSDEVQAQEENSASLSTSEPVAAISGAIRSETHEPTGHLASLEEVYEVSNATANATSLPRTSSTLSLPNLEKVAATSVCHSI